MKKKVTISVESKFSTTKWKTVVPSVTNLHTIKKELLSYLECNGNMPVSYESSVIVQLRLVVNGKSWNLPDFNFDYLYNSRDRLNDKINNLFRDVERIIDLHEAFYEN